MALRIPNSPGKKKGVFLTLATLVLFTLMLAAIITYVTLNLTYSTQASQSFASSGVSALSSNIKASIGPLLSASLQAAMGNYLPANSALIYPINASASNSLSSLVNNGMVGSTIYNVMNTLTMNSIANSIVQQAGREGLTLSFYNQSVNVFQTNPLFLNATYYSFAFVNSSSGSFTFPVNASVAIPLATAYVNITVSNRAPGAANAPFQQMIQFNPSTYNAYLGFDLGNIRFYKGNTGLYSWCESGCTSASTNAIFWVQLNAQISGSSSSIIQMAFLPRTVEYSKSPAQAYAGEAPQLSSTYAQYDNGASVFNNYWDWAGTTAPSGWTASVSMTATVNNGLSLSSSAASQYYQSGTSASTPAVAETYGGFTASSLRSALADNSLKWEAGIKAGGGDFRLGSTTDTSFSGAAQTANEVWGLSVSGSSGAFYNYRLEGTSTVSPASALTWGYEVGSSNKAYINWLRTRTYPPGGSMPSTVFGTVVPVVSTIPTYTTGPITEYIYCVGGANIQSAYYAPLSSTGIGTWTATSSYPASGFNSAKSGSCAQYNGYIYCAAGGNSGSYFLSYYAPLSSTGIGAWSSTTSYPLAVYGVPCATYQGYMYCLGGTFISTTYYSTTYYAPISSTGIGAWTSTTSYPTSLTEGQCNAANGYIYCGPMYASGANNYYAPISSTGIGTWTASTSYPSLTGSYYGTSCPIYDGYIYCVGNNAQPGTATYYGPVGTGVSSWTSTTSYPLNEQGASCAVFGGDIYCVAGGLSGGSVNTVYYASASSSGIGSWTLAGNYPVQTTGETCVTNT